MDLGRHFIQTCTYIYIYIDWHWILMTLDGETSPSIWPVSSSHQIREALTALGADVLAPWFHQFPYDKLAKKRGNINHFFSCHTLRYHMKLVKYITLKLFCDNIRWFSHSWFYSMVNLHEVVARCSTFAFQLLNARLASRGSIGHPMP